MASNSDTLGEDQTSQLNSLHELLGLRDLITNLSRRLFQVTSEFEESRSQDRKERGALLSIIVEIIDNFGRALGGIKSSEKMSTTASHSSAKNWIGHLIGAVRSPASSTDIPWMESLECSFQAALSRLEGVGIRNVPLMGLDLRKAQFEGEPLNRWVTIHGASSNGSLVVEEELSGLWIQKTNDGWMLIQRGEVIVGRQ